METLAAVPPLHEVIQLLRDWSWGLFLVALIWAARGHLP